MPPFSRISVVVPAHDEEHFIEPCLLAIAEAAQRTPVPVEMVVVLNRCSDNTEGIAAKYGATRVVDDSRCISQIRNHGVWASSGDIIVTCDADSQLHPTMLSRVVEELEKGAVGGGVDVRCDRHSIGIAATMAFIRLCARLTRVSAGAFWTTRHAFESVGGFNERSIMAEDYEFARRLRAWGVARRMPFRTLWDSPLVTSARKFDKFGDWVFFRMLIADGRRIRRSLKGQDREFADKFFYDFDHRRSDRTAADAPRRR